jgi:hypothetical protein
MPPIKREVLIWHWAYCGWPATIWVPTGTEPGPIVLFPNAQDAAGLSVMLPALCLELVDCRDRRMSISLTMDRMPPDRTM